MPIPINTIALRTNCLRRPALLLRRSILHRHNNRLVILHNRVHILHNRRIILLPMHSSQAPRPLSIRHTPRRRISLQVQDILQELLLHPEATRTPDLPVVVGTKM